MNPFIKVDWEDTPENLTQERIKRVKSYFEKKYNSTNVKIVTKIAISDSKTKLKSLEVSDNILDFEYQKKIVKDFIKENNINIKWELIDRLDNKVNSQIDKLNQDKVRYNKWFIKKIEFSNFLSFGENNVIDFKELNGITVIESTPRNFGGKTTATVDLLMFLFFNSTTKTKTNIEVFNKFSDVDDVKVKGHVVIDGDEYVITRTVSRKKNKSGEYTVKNDLDFSKISEDGTIKNLSGEQRRETEQIIVSAIGTEEDFLSTILTTGNNLEELIESKPTARGQILTKFLGLENLKQKEEICKTIYNDWSKKLISNTNNIIDLENKNISHNDDIEKSKSEIIRLKNELKKIEKKLKKLEDDRENLLKKRNNDIDQDLIKINPDVLNKEINELKKKKEEFEKLTESINVTEPYKYYLEEDHEKLVSEINDLKVEKKLNIDNIKRNENLIKQFEEGSICPTCKRQLEEVDHTDEINNLKKLIEELKEKEDQYQIKLSELQKEEIVFSDLKKEYDEYERNKLRKAKHELDVGQKQLEIDSKENKLSIYESNKNKLEENKKIDSEVIFFKTQIETTNGDIRQITTNIERETNNIKNLEEKIVINNDLILKIKSEEELISVFKIYLAIYGKNGISKVIIKNMIPLLNQELHRLLSES